MRNLKRHAPLFLGLAIPLGMIAFVAASIYLPGLFVHPHSDFVYTIGRDDYHYNYESSYAVANARIRTVAPTNLISGETATPDQIYIYHVATDTSEKLTFDQAQALSYSDDATSPDGFRLDTTYSGGGSFLFFFDSGSSNPVVVMTGHGLHKKLNIDLSGSSGGDNFHRLGWVRS